MKRLMIALATMGGLMVQAADTWYVNAAMADDTGDGKSEATATKYIQTAINKAASGDQVIVLPGDYNDGVATGAGWAPGDTRVVIYNKKIRLTAKEGRTKTFITGSHATSDSAGTITNNCGAGAVRCVAINGAGAKGTIIEGFTIRNGSATYSGGIARNTGGVYVNSSVDNQAYVCDCTIRDCRGMSGAAGLSRGTAVRTLFARNCGYSGGNINTPTLENCNLLNCIISRDNSYYTIYGGCMVNCSVTECYRDNVYFGAGPSWSRDAWAYNCILHNNGGNGPYNRLSEHLHVESIYNSVATKNSTGRSGNFGYAEESITNSTVATHWIGPAGGDFRLVSGSNAIGLGKSKWLSEAQFLGSITIPEEYANRDYDGKLIDTTKEYINAGAVQEVAGEAASSFTFGDTTSVAKTVEINGFPAADGSTVTSYYNSDKWPSEVVLKYVGTGTLCAFRRSDISYGKSILTTNDECRVMMFPAGSTKFWRPITAAAVYYVDDAKADDEGDGLSKATAKKTIQAAIGLAETNAVSEALIMVAPGTYSTGGRELSGLTSRVAIPSDVNNIYIRSEMGAEHTTILGAKSQTSEDGYGADAVRCVAFNGRGFLQGFTLTGGYTSKPASGASSDSSCYGGGMYANAGRTDTQMLWDCVVTNNHASGYSALYCGGACRTYIADNARAAVGSNGNVISLSLLVLCKIALPACSYSIMSESHLINCTVQMADGYVERGFETPTVAYNCILVHCGGLQSYSAACKFYGNTLWRSSYNPILANGTGVGDGWCITNNPCLAVNNSSFQPEANSGIGATGTMLEQEEEYTFLGGDFNGDPLVFGTDGRIMPGAVHSYYQGVYVTNTLESGVTYNNCANGWNDPEVDDMTITASTAGRPFRGFRVDGEYVTPRTLNIALDSNYAGKTVEVVFTSEWYADANNGNDANDGMSPESAKETLAAVMNLKALRQNDTVHAAAGLYNKGTMRYGGAWYKSAANGNNKICELDSRVVVTNKTKLIADEGPEKTIIMGAMSTDASAKDGCGLGAVRCVTLTAGATLEGFTVTGGYTLYENSEGKSEDDDCWGGGTFCPHTSSCWVRNCIITNNHARGGGGICCANAVNNRICDNYAVSAPATWVVEMYGNYIDHYRTASSPVWYCQHLEGNTFGPDIKDASGNLLRPIGAFNDGAAHDYRCNVYLGKAPNGMGTQTHRNSVFIKDSGYGTAVTYDGCYFVDSLEDAYVDSDCRPIAGSGSVLLGNGDVTLFPIDNCKGVDAFGNPRFSNNALDIGAVQSVWNERYAKVLGGRTVCTLASTNVYETATGVCLNTTGELEIETKRAVTAGKTMRAAWNVVGNGSLKVYLDGELYGSYTAADASELQVAVAAGNHAFRFAYEPGENDTASAEIRYCRTVDGTVFVIR